MVRRLKDQEEVIHDIASLPGYKDLPKEERDQIDAVIKRRVLLQRRKLDLLSADRCSNSLEQFVKEAWPVMYGKRQLSWNWHMSVGCEMLQAMRDGQIHRLLMCWPPRTLKSNLVSVFYHPFVWSKQPNHQFITLSHRGGIAERDAGRSRRLMQADWYLKRWGEEFYFTADQNEKKRYINSEGGHRISQGIMSGVIGEDADCLVGETIVKTEYGLMRVDLLHQLRHRPRVLSFNHATGKPEYRRVVASRVMCANEIIHFTTAHGREIKATERHRVYVDRSGYRPAGSVREGESFVALVPGLFGAEGRIQQGLCDLSPRIKENGVRHKLRALCHRVFNSSLEPEQKTEGQSEAILLQHGAFTSASCREAPSPLPSMQQSSREKDERILFSGMPQRRFALWKMEAAAFVQKLRGVVHAYIPVGSVLLKGMFERSAFCKDVWSRQFASYGNGNLSGALPRNASAHYEAGQDGLRFLRRKVLSPKDAAERQADGARRTSDPSYQRGQDRQCAGELSNAVQYLSYVSSQIETDRIEVARRIHKEGVEVYDIQVEGNGNFFANEILVHNSVIVDDPSDPKKLMNEKQREKINDEIWPDIQLRLNDQMVGNIIVMLQRIHEGDLAGHIIDTDTRKEFIRVIFPLEFEEDHPTPCKFDIRKKEGELLDAKRFPREYIDALKERTNAYIYSGRFQQRPSLRGGNVLMRQWWQVWTEPELPSVEMILISLDTAFKESQENDYTACTVWGLWKPNPKAKRYSMILLHAWRERSRYSIMKAKVIATIQKWTIDDQAPDHIIIEDKASGHSLIQDFSDAGVDVFAYNPGKESLLFRANIISDVLEDGNIWVPGRLQQDGKRSDRVLASFAEMLVKEAERFPKDDHDDLVTTAIQAWHFAADNGYIEASLDLPMQEFEPSSSSGRGGAPQSIY